MSFCVARFCVITYGEIASLCDAEIMFRCIFVQEAKSPIRHLDDQAHLLLLNGLQKEEPENCPNDDCSKTVLLCQISKTVARVFKIGPKGLLFFIFVLSLKQKIPMSRFEPRTSGIGSNNSCNPDDFFNIRPLATIITSPIV